MLRNALLAGLVLAAFGAASCSGSAAPSRGSSGDEDITPLRRELAGLADRPPVKLTASRLPRPPAGYTEADVRRLADQATKIAIKSFDPRLSSLTPDAAVEKVLEGLYDDTKDDYLPRLARATFGYPHEWVIASRFRETPQPVKFIRVAWSAKLMRGTLEGSPGKYLSLTLQVHGSQYANESDTAPVVVRRTITLSGWRPRGGPDWWPSLTMAATTYGSDGCVLTVKPELVATDDEATLRADVASLRLSLRGTRVMPETSTSQTAYDDFARECRSNSNH